MKSKSFLLMLGTAMLWLVTITFASAQDVIQIGVLEIAPTDSVVKSSAILTDPVPDPFPISNPTPPAWNYFWMFQDGVFSRKPIVTRPFQSNGDYGSSLQIRGSYTPDREPPNMRAVDPNLTGSGGVDAVGVDTFLRSNDNTQGPALKDLHLEANWRAAQAGDTVFFALIVKNNATFPQSGILKVALPKDSFEYINEVFPGSQPFMFYEGSDDIPATTRSLPLTIYEWDINNLPPQRTQTVFMRTRIVAQKDSIAHVVRADLQWDSEIPFVNQPDLFGTNPDKAGTAATNPYWFDTQASTTVSMSAARDPNSLTITPDAVPPAAPAPVHRLSHRVNVENVGNAPAFSLKIDVTFDSRMDMSTLPAKVSMYVGGILWRDTMVFRKNGRTATVFMKEIRLQPSLKGENPFGSGYLEFDINTNAGLTLNAGDRLVSRAVITMLNALNGINDKVSTGPAYVHVMKPGRLPYGWVVGLKGSHHSPTPDSVRNRSLSLVFQIPLRNPTVTSPGIRTIPEPKWWWQLELGGGNSAFNVGAGRFTTQVVHFTPAMLRYTGWRIQNRVNVGVSAGYSADLVVSAQRNGANFSLPSGLGNRLEHELAASIDLFNMAGVPGLSIGAGYKSRQNKLAGTSVRYDMPFAYAQLNFALLQRRQIRLWNKLYRF